MPNNPVIYQSGDKHWYDAEGAFHREDGPAVIRNNGYKAWYIHGQPHRIDGPAREWSIGRVEYWINGTLYETEEKYWNKIKELGMFQVNRQTKVSRFKRLEVK